MGGGEERGREVGRKGRKRMEWVRLKKIRSNDEKEG